MEHQGQYAFVNGINLYYETFGVGKPLILLHGGLGVIEMFAQIMPWLRAGRYVIGVDLQAHGRTADIDRPITYEAMADDIAALIVHLGFEQVDIMGYSLGAGTAMQVAIRHGALVRRLVYISSAYKRDGWYPEVLEGMSQLGPATAEQMKPSPIYEIYTRLAPRPQDWPVLVGKVGDLLRQEYDWSSSVVLLNMPILLIFGDSDSVTIPHILSLFELLGGGQVDGGLDGSGVPTVRLAILPGTTHHNILSSTALEPIIRPFLDVKDE
jgi:pimeloyl-ACP methyl ester carboxylesterase